MTTVAVIGGGIAGLTAARRLGTAGVDVRLFERDRLGGKLRTSDFAGRPVDEGADAFLARVPWALDLARELGLEAELTAPAQRSAYVYVDGALRRLPEEQLLGVPTALDDPVVRDLLGTPGVAAARRDLDQPGPAPAADEDPAIGPFLRSRLGDEVVDRLVGPLVGGINAGDVDRLSMAAVTPQLDAAARSGEPSLIRAAAALRHQAASTATSAEPPPVFLAPRDGMGYLVDALAAELTTLGVAVELGAAAEGLEADGKRWRVLTSDGRDVDVDGVVVAVPGRAAGDLLAPLAPGAGAFLQQLELVSVALVTLAVARERVGRPLDASGFLVPRSAGLLVTACSWSSAKWAPLAPARGDGTELLRASVGRDGDQRFLDMDDDELVAAVVDDLRRTMDLGGEPAAARVSRWPRSFPQYRPRHLKAVEAAEAELAQRAATIALAGASLRGVGIPACIRSGTEAADQLVAALAAAP